MSDFSVAVTLIFSAWAAANALLTYTEETVSGKGTNGSEANDAATNATPANRTTVATPTTQAAQS